MIDPNEFKPPSAPDSTAKAYVYDDDVIRAVRVALATGRPLLLRGPPGCGKSTLARDVARRLGANYYQEVVTSRTEARDLEWRFDAVRRLAEAQIPGSFETVKNAANYVEPRALWRGFDPDGAAAAGGKTQDDAGVACLADRPAVVLIDEIDKAEPEVANDLLEPFDVQRFTVAETGQVVEYRRDVVLIVTTNDERDLPAAFLRRCIVRELARPSGVMLKRIARSHLGTELEDPGVARMIARIEELGEQAQSLNLRAPGTAEFLDALRACRTIDTSSDPEWQAITRLALWKHTAAFEEKADE